MFGSGGGEAIDIALKSARHATRRRRVVSVAKAYHGHTGLAVATGDERFARLFLADRPDEFTHVPFNDLDAMEQALAPGDVAAVIMETIPATYGFPLPAPGYLRAVKELCDRHGSLYIADEVQTGLMRTGELWGITKHGVAPDLLVTGKGISGGMYPIAAVLATERAAAWMEADGFAHMSTFGGAEVGCIAALRCLEITTRPEVRAMSHHIAAFFTPGPGPNPGQIPRLVHRRADRHPRRRRGGRNHPRADHERRRPRPRQTPALEGRWRKAGFHQGPALVVAARPGLQGAARHPRQERR